MRPARAIVLAATVAAATAALAKGPSAAPILAQQIVDRFVAAHPELAALELAVTGDKGCKTIAATSHEDIGEACDADELGPIKTGKPDVEEPSKKDPVYDITQALHDASGTLIGAVGMDHTPSTAPTRDAVVARALELLHELEKEIPSRAALEGPQAP